MNNWNTSQYTSNHIRPEFWNDTILDDYNFLMSEELISQCKNSLLEPFYSYNDLIIHHVSYNEFEKQFLELFDWCRKSLEIIQENSSNLLTCYLRQRWYEDLYEQGSMRLRTFNQYSKKLIERFPDLKIVIEEKKKKILVLWMDVEGRLIQYFDEDFDRILQELYKELIEFEQWLNNIEDQLNQIHDCQQILKVQNEIKSKNNCVSSLLEICERLKNDYKSEIDRIPFDYLNNLENHWHQIWIYSLEIQCKFEEQQSHFSLSSFDDDDDDDDIIPFNSSEYEKISLTSSINIDSDQKNFLVINRKRRRSPITTSISMAKSKRRLSLNKHSHLSSSMFYYSLTNIDNNNNNNDDDDDDDDDQRSIPIKKFKKTSSKLDIGYASEDDLEKRSIYLIKKSQSDGKIYSKMTSNLLLTYTHSLPLFNSQLSWKNSITSAYETSSNPDIDLSFEERKKTFIEPSLSIYQKKYLNSSFISHSYDASVDEYTDGDQSENDIDILTSIPIHHFHKGKSLFYNRYAPTITTTTGYSSDIEQNSSDDQPYWDGYQNPLYRQDIDSMESSTLKWDEQFLEMDQLITDEQFNRLIHKTNPSLIISKDEQFDSDSDIDDLNYVINETDRQLIKTREILTKNSSSNKQRIYNELIRTCQTNIECLETILNNLHQSNHSRLYNTRVVQLFQSYLSHWYEMHEQVNNNRRYVEDFNQINQRIELFKNNLDDEYSHMDKPIDSLIEFQNDLIEQLKKEQRTRMKLSHLINEYHFICPYGQFNEHFILNQLSTKIDQYHIQLRTLLNLIEKLLPIENELEQKLITTNDYPIDLLELQTLIEQYARLIPTNTLHIYCQMKLKSFRQMFTKHVRYQSMNFNNNNSSTPTDEQQITGKKFSLKQHDEIRELQEDFTSTSKELSLPQTSSTSSYISDDYKVLYIETIIEVNKPVFYERITNINEMMNSHENNRNRSDSTDGELSNPHKPVRFNNFTQYMARNSLENNNNDDDDNMNQLPFTQRSSNRKPLFPRTNNAFKETYQPTYDYRTQRQESFDYSQPRIIRRNPIRRSFQNRCKDYFFRSLRLGLIILVLLFLIYFFALDRCTQSDMVKGIIHIFIRIDRDGTPTI